MRRIESRPSEKPNDAYKKVRPIVEKTRTLEFDSFVGENNDKELLL